MILLSLNKHDNIFLVYVLYTKKFVFPGCWF